MINGILLLYERPYFVKDASTVMEHIESFQRYSIFKVWTVNTALGFPKALKHLQFSVILLHYSLPATRRKDSKIVGFRPHLSKVFSDYIKQCSESYKVIFYQDEYYYCQQRIAFLNHYRINCVYTLAKPDQFEDIYGESEYNHKLVHTIPGYVSEELVDASHRHDVPEQNRLVDVGYRGRQLDYYMGKGAQEKINIANGFKKHGHNLGLTLDIKTEERYRFYGEKWYEFLANCRAVLGVEAGVSIFDISGKIRLEYDRLMALKPDMSFEEISELYLSKWEDRIPYRTCSPRNFEAAAFRACQILFEGSYSKIMEPMVHYIPLKKDFSNFHEVIKIFRDKNTRLQIAENAYRDLIISPTFRYESFIKDFDQELLDTGINTHIPDSEIDRVESILPSGPSATNHRIGLLNRIKIYMLEYPFPGRYSVFPGRKHLSFFLKPLYNLFKGN